jgi:hypothetical protein
MAARVHDKNPRLLPTARLHMAAPMSAISSMGHQTAPATQRKVDFPHILIVNTPLAVDSGADRTHQS